MLVKVIVTMMDIDVHVHLLLVTMIYVCIVYKHSIKAVSATLTKQSDFNLRPHDDWVTITVMTHTQHTVRYTYLYVIT